MTVDEWARAHLISQVPADLPVWHWTHARAAVGLRERFVGAGSLADFSEGATGRGFYVSASAIDSIDKGDEVVHGIVPAGTRVLMVEPDLFGFGVAEIFEMLLSRHGWKWRARPWHGLIDPERARPPKATVPGLLERLDLAGCVYIFGFHLALMIRDATSLRVDPLMDPALTVAEYVKQHPEERPMLVPVERVHRWLEARIPGWRHPDPRAATGRKQRSR